MNDSTRYKQSEMQAGIEALRTASNSLNDYLDTLKGELATSLAQWEDQARNKYAEVQQEWDNSAKNQKDIINRISMILRDISDGYDATERSNEKLWNK